MVRIYVAVNFIHRRIMCSVNKPIFLMGSLISDSHNISIWRSDAKTTNPIISPTLGRLSVNVIYKRELISVGKTSNIQSEY